MPGPVFLEGDNVTLRPTEREDLPAIREWMNDPDVWRPALDAKPMNGDLAEDYFERVLVTEDDVHVTVCVDERSESTERGSGAAASSVDERSESTEQASGEERPASSADERSESTEQASGEGRPASSADEVPVGHASLTTTEYGPTATERARSVELAYHLGSDHHGNGYGSEAAELLVQYAFEDWNMRRVFARAGAFNDASVALLESLGFEREGRRREAAYYRGDYYDMYLYGLLREEWAGR